MPSDRWPVRTALLRKFGVAANGTECASGRPSQESLVLSTLRSTVWHVVPYLPPNDSQSLSCVSLDARELLLPAAQQCKRSRELAQDLEHLPFGFGFFLPALE